MLTTIQIPTVLRRFTDNTETVAVDAATVREALAELARRYPALEKHLFDGDGKLRSFINVYLGTNDVRHLPAKHETALRAEDQLTIVPSIAGGTDELTADDILRYSRHLMLPEVGMAGQKKLKAASVLVVGAGGLGSPLLAYLAAAGVGRIGIVDADTVDVTNLQRQIIHGTRQLGQSKLASARDFIANLNPGVQVDLFDTFLTSANALEIARPYDLLIDGTDNFPTRYLVNDVSVLLGKPNVYGSIFRFEGQASVFGAKDGPCYRCLYPEPPPPGLVPSCAEGGVLGVLPGIVGCIQANEALKLLLGIGTPLVGRLLRFDALTMQFREFTLQKDADCPVCGTHPSIRAPIDYYAFCGVPQNAASGADIPATSWIDARELARDLARENGRRPFVLDVRNPEEAAISRIAGAHLIPLAELDGRLHEIDRAREVVIHCHTSSRSVQAWHLLRDAGFERLQILKGGIRAWAEEVDPEMAVY